MNENRMKTSVNTGEVSLRWAKKADQRAKSSENGPISPNCYLLGLRKRLDYGPRRQKFHENAGNNHLKTVNIRSNGKSRVKETHPAGFPGAIPFGMGTRLSRFLEGMGDFQAAMLVGLFAWAVSTFFYAPPFWLSLGGGGHPPSRIDDFIKLCQNPLRPDVDPLLAYRRFTPVVAWLLGLRGISGVILQYAAIPATLALIYHVAARRSDRLLALFITLGIACTYAIIWTNTMPGYPDSVTELTAAFILLSPNPVLAAGMAFAGILNDERFAVMAPFLVLWHSGMGSPGAMFRRTWQLVLGLAVGLAGAMAVRHAMAVGWIGPGIPRPHEYRDFHSETASLTPMLGRRNFLLNIPLGFRAMWSVPVLFLVCKTPASPFAKVLFFISLAGTVLATAIAADVARNIGFLYPALLIAACWCYRDEPQLTLKVCLFSLAACLLLPAFYYPGAVQWQRPLPLSLLRAATGWDVLQLFHHAPRTWHPPG
jgi:hypothetical protein